MKIHSKSRLWAVWCARLRKASSEGVAIVKSRLPEPLQSGIVICQANRPDSDLVVGAVLPLAMPLIKPAMSVEYGSVELALRE